MSTAALLLLSTVCSVSQATEYYKAARFSTAQSAIFMTDRDVPSPKLDLAVQRTAAVQHRVMWLRTRRTTHVWPQTPKTLPIQEALFMELDRRWSWGQASRSAVKWCLSGEGSETRSFTPPSTAPQNVTCELNHRGQRLTWNTACSIPEGWKLS